MRLLIQKEEKPTVDLDFVTDVNRPPLFSVLCSYTAHV